MIEEIEDAVNNIDQDIFESTGCEYLNITVRSNGFIQIVDFVGIRIWNSEDDEREDINMDGDKEPIETFLRRRIKEELRKLLLIRV